MNLYDLAPYSVPSVGWGLEGNDFAKTLLCFFFKCDLGKTIRCYMVLVAAEQKRMIMRPYQSYAVQDMVECIDTKNGDGFVWHATGSGKMLNSLKGSTMLMENESIHKCVTVVDPKNLDCKTREEFNLFQEGCVEENTRAC